MNHDEFDIIREIRASKLSPKKIIRTKQLGDDRDRTLLYGCTSEAETFHVYLKDGLIHRLIYSRDNPCISFESGEFLEAEKLAPSSKAYPERCDTFFVLLMDDSGVEVRLGAFSERVYEATLGDQFHGNVV